MGEDDLALYTKMVGEPFYSWTPLAKYGDPSTEVVEDNVTGISRKRKELTPEPKIDHKRNKNGAPDLEADKSKPGIPHVSSASVTDC